MERMKMGQKKVEVANLTSMSGDEWRAFLQSVRNKPSVEVVVDLSTVGDPMEFKIQARRLKAFLETPHPGQGRKASIIATQEQKRLEPNVFESGVDFIEA